MHQSEAGLHLDESQLLAGLAHVLQSPLNHGTLEAIVIRPRSNERIRLDRCELSPERGVHGDRYESEPWLRLPDGRPHPDAQVAVMNSRAIQLVSGDSLRWQLAGDNLFVDLNLSVENLPAGQRLKVGSVLLEVASQAHNGCPKFTERFGEAAVRFVNSPERKQWRLRGLFLRVLQPGWVAVGDRVEKV